MDISEEIRRLMKDKEYLAAGKIVDSELSKDKENHYLWYLRGIISLKSKNYPHALECFENALQIKKDFEYLRAKGMTYFEMFEFEEALIEFEEALKFKKDSEIYFYISICCMFLDDPRSKDYLETAYLRDKEKTKKLLSSFYNSVFKNSWQFSDSQKQNLEKIIKSIK